MILAVVQSSTRFRVAASRFGPAVISELSPTKNVQSTMEERIMKNVTRSSVLCLAILLIVSMSALAASKDNVSTSKNGRQTMASKPAMQAQQLPKDPFSGLTILYNNSSSYPLGKYWCCTGYTITGSGSIVGEQFADGMPFTPSVNATVTHIGVAVGWVTGTNEVTVTLNADNGGLPGSVLGTFNISSLPSFGSCCSVEVESLSGVPVNAGTQYWVVVQSTTPTNDTWAAWNDNDTNETNQPFAFQQAGVWGASQGILGAFGVAGTTN